MDIARVSGAVIGGDGPGLDYAALVAAGVFVPEFETAALEDWCFDQNGAASLAGKLDATTLTMAGGSPTHAAGYLTVPPTGLNGLMTPYEDRIGWTYAAVVRRPETAPTAALVVASTAAGSTSGGEFLYWNPNGRLIVNVRGYDSQIGTSLDTATTIAAGSWGFVAVSSRLLTEAEANVSHTHRHDLFIGAGNADPLLSDRTGIKTLSTSSRKISWGNAYQTITNYDEKPLDIHRGIVLPRYMSTLELAALYKRVKIVAARRGITVV